MEKEMPKRSAKKKNEKAPERPSEEAKGAEAQPSPQPKTGVADKGTRNAEGRFISSEARPSEPRSKSEDKTGRSLRFHVTQRKEETPREISVSSAVQVRTKPTPEQLECEADLYASIATLNSLMINFEKGNLELATYKRQVQSLITDIMKCKTILERTGISMKDFLKAEGMLEKYPVICERFKLLESGATLEAFVESLNVTKADVASGTAEIVTNLITLSDYAHLGGDMAKVEALIPLIDKLSFLLQSFPTTRGDYWGMGLLRDWHTKLSTLPVDAVLTPEEARKLELDVARLLDDFKRRLREI